MLDDRWSLNLIVDFLSQENFEGALILSIAVHIPARVATAGTLGTWNLCRHPHALRRCHKLGPGPWFDESLQTSGMVEFLIWKRLLQWIHEKYLKYLVNTILCTVVSEHRATNIHLFNSFLEPSKDEGWGTWISQGPVPPRLLRALGFSEGLLDGRTFIVFVFGWSVCSKGALRYDEICEFGPKLDDKSKLRYSKIFQECAVQNRSQHLTAPHSISQPLLPPLRTISDNGYNEIVEIVDQ